LSLPNVTETYFSTLNSQVETKVTKKQIHKRLEDLGLSVTSAAEMLGMSRQNFNKHLAADEISQHFVRLFKEKLGLLETKVSGSGKVGEGSVKYASESNAQVIDLGDSLIMKVPIVNHYAWASYLNGYADPEYIETLPSMHWLVEKEHKGKYLTFVSKNDSMDNGTVEGYVSGDKLLGREVPKHHWRNKLHIKRWKDFVIIHRTDGIIFKRIIKHDIAKGIITLHSLNPAYEDFEVHLDDVLELYNVVMFNRSK
jgi:hypothetical protein